MGAKPSCAAPGADLRAAWSPVGGVEAEIEAAVECADVACTAEGTAGDESEGASANDDELACFSLVRVRCLADELDEARIAKRFAESDMAVKGMFLRNDSERGRSDALNFSKKECSTHFRCPLRVNFQI